MLGFRATSRVAQAMHHVGRLSDETDLIWGIHPCAAVLASGSRRILRVIQDSSGGTSAAPIFSLAASRGLSSQRVDRLTFSRMFGDASAQGVGMVVARASPVCVDDTVEFQAGTTHSSSSQPAVVLALDELTDPHNVGAILRTAYLMDVAAVLVSERNSAPLNGTVSKTSSGALEWLLASRRLLVTRHLASLLSGLRRESSWRVIGCSSSDPALSSGSTPSTASRSVAPCPLPFSGLHRSESTVLVLGNEGRGLRPSVLQSCSHTVVAPMKSSSDLQSKGRTPDASGSASFDAVARLGAVDSYNVSVAAAVLLAKLQF